VRPLLHIRATRHHSALLVAALLAGCGTARLHDGPPLAPGDAAIVRADPAVSAGLPVQVRLRRVNDREVGISSNRVELPPGKHAFLVDCRVAASGSVRRFTVEAEVEAGGRYRFVANANPRNCEAVALIAD
jgi:hypothetical protein